MKLVFFIALLFINSPSEARTYYFSNNSGNDNYTIQQAQNKNTPWKTLSKLNFIFNTLQPGDSVLFNRGEAFYGSIIISKSGSSSNPIYLGAYGYGGKPIITGLSSISSWINIGGGLYEKTLKPAPTKSLNIVTFQDNIQPIGRFPKADQEERSYFKNDSLIETKNNLADTVYILSHYISHIPTFVGGEIVRRTQQWVFDRGIIESQNLNRGLGKIKYHSIFPYVDGIPKTYASMLNHGFFFQNHKNALSILGDWAFDQKTKKITMFFGSKNPENYSIKYTSLDDLVILKNINNIIIQNIIFKGANENLVSSNNMSNCKFDKDEFRQAGINGIDLTFGYGLSHYNTITNCLIRDILNNGLTLENSDHWYIANNHIAACGLIPGMGMSSDGSYIGIQRVGSHSIVENNEIDSIGYHAIWYTGDNTIIRFNHVHHYMLKKSDGGGIYTYGVTGTSRKIYRNIVHDGPGDNYGTGITDNSNPYTRQAHGIYNDGNSTGVTISNNTCFNNAVSGIWFGSNGEITATENICYNNKVAQIQGNDEARPYSNITIKNNILFARDSGSLILSFNINNISLSQLTIDSNYYCRPLWEPLLPNPLKGYSKSFPNFSWNSYNDGGTIQMGNPAVSNSDSFYSLENWKKLTGKDINSLRTPIKNITLYNILFEYNATTSVRKIHLVGDYFDVKGKKYTGSLELEPYTSIILLKGKYAEFPIQEKLNRWVFILFLILVSFLILFKFSTKYTKKSKLNKYFNLYAYINFLG